MTIDLFFRPADAFVKGFLLVLLICGSLCYGKKSVEVVGIGECGDCKVNNIKISHAFSGLKVSVDCKLEDGSFKTRGVGELDTEGYFKVSLPHEILNDGKLAEECYVQLHSAVNTPCPVYDGIKVSKITLHSKSDKKHTFGLTGKLKFSSAVCTSAFFWTFFTPPPLTTQPPLAMPHPGFKNFGPLFVLPPLPPKVFPPFPFPPKIPFEMPPPPPLPIPTPPVVDPPPVPVSKPTPKPSPLPINKPKPKPPVFKRPPVPINKPKPKPKSPVSKPPTVPISKPKPKTPVNELKPMPPPIPINKPLPPLAKIVPPPIPIYKPLPPFYKTPCPPFSFPKLPPMPPN